MKEIECQKYSLGQYKKKVKRIMAAYKIISITIPLLLPLLITLITQEYEALSIYILVPFFIIIIVSSQEDTLDRNWELEYKIWLSSIVSKQRAKQDRKNRKWLM